jgi:hypothetical protein
LTGRANRPLNCSTAIPNGGRKGLHRDKGPAVISQGGTWEEFWYHGELVAIRVYGSVEIVDAQKD